MNAMPVVIRRQPRFEIGQRVRMVRVVDDLRCRHVASFGTVMELLEVSYLRGEPRYFISFGDPPGAHACYESELEPVLQ